MVSKKILGLAIAAAFSSQAFAVVDLDAKTGQVKFAKQALLSTATQTGNVGGATFYEVSGPGNILDFSADIGVGVAVGDQIFIRVALTNAVFETAAAAADLEVAGTASTSVAQGGQAGDAYAIFAVTAPVGGFAQTAQVDVFLADLAISGTASVGYGFTVYETLTAAVNQTGSLYTKSLDGVVNVVDALAVTATAETSTADVSTDFKKFTGGISDVLQQLGSLTVVPATTVYGQTGVQVVAADVYSAANVKIAGDFSVGTWAIDAAGNNCASPTALTLNTAKTEATATLAALNADPELCVTVNGTTVIPKGSYTAAVSFTPAAGAAFGQSTVNAAVGTVAHNGTTIQVPYLTTFADYAQRLVLVNRGGVPAAYTVTFTEEAGVTASAGAAAAGTLAANETKIIKVTDLVTLTGATRTAATVNIVAVSTNIDAATTSVNLADKSTDTVKLH